jgi:hypothetical protein
MRETDGARAATAEHPAAHKVAPRFTRAAEAERSRLEGKREQLLRKREAVQAELGEIDRAVGAIGELLDLVAPLLPANGREPGAANDESRAEADRGAEASERGEADEGDRAPALIVRDARATGRSSPTRSAATNQRQPTKENHDERTGDGESTRRPDISQALMDAAHAIADMARRVQLNGPEPVYTSEKLGHALYKAAEGLALCGVEIDEVMAEVAVATSMGCG